MKETLPLKTRLVNYLKRQNGWVSGRDLQMLTMKFAGQTGKTASRRLQEAVSEGLLEVQYVRGAAQFRAVQAKQEVAKTRVTWQEARAASLEMWNSIK